MSENGPKPVGEEAGSEEKAPTMQCRWLGRSLLMRHVCNRDKGGDMAGWRLRENKKGQAASILECQDVFLLPNNIPVIPVCSAGPSSGAKKYN